MGWSWSKSKSFGPFRVNMSKSGVGFSVGGKGFRTGVNASGRKYSTVSVPGTGLRYSTGGGAAKGGSGSSPKAKAGCMGMIAMVISLAAVVVLAISGRLG